MADAAVHERTYPRPHAAQGLPPSAGPGRHDRLDRGHAPGSLVRVGPRGTLLRHRARRGCQCHRLSAVINSRSAPRAHGTAAAPSSPLRRRRGSSEAKESKPTKAKESKPKAQAPKPKPRRSKPRTRARTGSGPVARDEQPRPRVRVQSQHPARELRCTAGLRRQQQRVHPRPRLQRDEAAPRRVRARQAQGRHGRDLHETATARSLLRVTTWRVVDPGDSGWAIAAQSTRA